MNRKMVVAAFALVALSGAANAKSALPGQYFDPSNQAPPLTVRKNLPFTDSGTAAPVGYENDYVVEQTTLNRPVYSSFAPDLFGQSVLPGPFNSIGRGQFQGGAF